MNIPKDMKSVEAMFESDRFEACDNYWFSYKNKSGDVIDIFQGKIEFFYSDGRDNFVLRTKDIAEIKSNIPIPLDAGKCSLTFCTKGGDYSFDVDTVSKGKYFDIFPLSTSLKRRVILDS